jgi:choline transport protein
LTTVLFVFPPVLPVTGNNMNYCIVAFAIVIIISVFQWYIDGKKNYTGPKLDVDAMKNGEVVGLAPEPSNGSPAGDDLEDNEKIASG